MRLNVGLVRYQLLSHVSAIIYGTVPNSEFNSDFRYKREEGVCWLLFLQQRCLLLGTDLVQFLGFFKKGEKFKQCADLRLGM
jgi:hypothetical protein